MNTFLDQKITTAEMYNNLGVNYVNTALNLIEKEDFPFGLPLELDFNSRLYTITGEGKGPGDDEEGVQHYGTNDEEIRINLQQALSYFDLAMKLDDEHIQSYNNASAAYLLLGEFDEAWVKARKAKKLAKSFDFEIALRNSLDLLAIIAYLQDELDDANEYWEEAIELNSRIAQHNKTLYQDDAGLASLAEGHDEAPGLGDPVVFTRPSFKDIEKIDGESLYDMGQEYIYNGKPMETWQLKGQKAMVGHSEQAGDSFLIFAPMDRSRMLNPYFFYFIDEQSDRSSSLEIGNGSKAHEVETTYGTPANIMSTTQHDYWVYIHKNIIFKINQNDIVDGWIIYDVNL